MRSQSRHGQRLQSIIKSIRPTVPQYNGRSIEVTQEEYDRVQARFNVDLQAYQDAMRANPEAKKLMQDILALEAKEGGYVTDDNSDEIDAIWSEICKKYETVAEAASSLAGWNRHETRGCFEGKFRLY